ncbi:MAG: hypothetical protein Q9227_006628 [Pyrenula ochraceoflavens]
MIELNPLVIHHEPTKPPKDAPADEFHAVWHELTDRIQYIPGLGTLASGQVKYKACFHDLPYGLQTHVYAPMGLDIKNKWAVRGNEPGEPREARELGLDTPKDGLYLREDVDMRCNRMMTSFVKKNLRNAHKVLVDRLMSKASLAEDVAYSLSRGQNHPQASILSSEGSLRGLQHGGGHFSGGLVPPTSPSLTASTAVSSPGFNHYTPYQYQKSISEIHSEQGSDDANRSPELYPPPLYHRVSGNAVPDEYRWQLQAQQFHQRQQHQAHADSGKQIYPAELPADHQSKLPAGMQAHNQGLNVNADSQKPAVEMPT